MMISSHIEMIYLKKCLARHILKKIGISDFIFSPSPPPPFSFCSAATDMSWFIIKKNKQKSLCGHSPNLEHITVMLLCGIVCVRTHWTHHSFKIPAKYHGSWCSLSTESDSKKPESTIRRLIADRGKCKPFLVVELVGQYKRVDLSAERRAWCGIKMKAVGLDSSNKIDSRINITTFFNFPDMFRRYIRHLQCYTFWNRRWI